MPEPADTVPAETLHALLREYAAARWPKADPEHEATNLAADPVYGGDPELVALADAAYAAGRASVGDGAYDAMVGIIRAHVAEQILAAAASTEINWAKCFREGLREAARIASTPTAEQGPR